MNEWLQATAPDWERWNRRGINDGAGDPHAGDGNPSTGDGNLSAGDGSPSTGDGNLTPRSGPEFDYMFGFPTTTEQMQAYWQMIGWSTNEAFRLDNYLILEKTIASTEVLGGTPETWLLFDVDARNVVYTGASVFPRQGLVSTTKGGAKLVRAMIISQVVTDFGYRCCGLATHFLNLLANQMDSREDDEHIAFSVLYSGPRTELFQRCG